MPAFPGRPLVLVVVGPTAVGKSALALELCERHAGEIVSVDSMQVYRGLDAATSKPCPEDRARAPHHGIDLAEPGDDFSMGDFVRAAERAIAGIVARRRLPVLVGGTGLYLRALLRGMAPAPRRDASLRRRLVDRADRRGTESLHRVLKRLDPETAARLGPRDRQRLVRALEVRIAAGRPLSAVLRDEPFGPERYDAVKIGLDMDRPLLHARIDARVDRFFAAGLVAEVRRLLGSGRPPSANAFKAIGYREVAAHLRGETGLEEARTLVRRNTRRYAKRQATWFRSETGVAWFGIDPASADPFAAPREHAAAALAARGVARMGLTIANLLTLARMVMIPLLVTLILSNHHGGALLVFIVAGVTDALDGLIARHWRQSSALGAFLDPTADKLLMTACFIILAIPDHPKSIPDFEIANHLPVYLTIVTISRDVFIVMVALLIHLTSGHRSFPPSGLGKATTTVQIVTVGTVLLLNFLERPAPILVGSLGWLTLALTVASGLHYIYRGVRLADRPAGPGGAGVPGGGAAGGPL